MVRNLKTIYQIKESIVQENVMVSGIRRLKDGQMKIILFGKVIMLVMMLCTLGFQGSLESLKIVNFVEKQEKYNGRIGILNMKET